MPEPHFQDVLSCLPHDFPHQVPQPKLKLGDRVYWIPLPNRDFGTVTGLQYAPAEHLCTWAWRYTIYLDSRSPSRAWTSTDVAWETDLELQSAQITETPAEEEQE